MGILLEWGVWGLGAGEMTMMVQRMRPVAPMKVEDVVGLSPIADGDYSQGAFTPLDINAKKASSRRKFSRTRPVFPSYC